MPARTRKTKPGVLRKVGEYFGLLARRFRVSQEALDYFAGKGARLDRQGRIEESILDALQTPGADEAAVRSRIFEEVPDASQREVALAAQRLLRDRRVEQRDGRMVAVQSQRREADSPWKSVVSSNVKAIGYYTSVKSGVKSVLGVQFLSGTTYFYDVPIAEFWRFLASPSKGKHLHWQIKIKNVSYDGPY